MEKKVIVGPDWGIENVDGNESEEPFDDINYSSSQWIVTRSVRLIKSRPTSGLVLIWNEIQTTV